MLARPLLALLCLAEARALALPAARAAAGRGAPAPHLHRRQLIRDVAWAAAGALGSCSVLQGAPAAVAAGKIDLNEQLVLILRVKEASAQETRLIKTGKYRELQRLNIKRAIRFMLDNYNLNERFTKASSFAPPSQIVTAGQYGQAAVESLIQILEYFPDKLVANDLTREQEKFVLAALASTDKNIDLFCELMPPTALAAAKAQVEEENRLNDLEYKESNEGEDLINLAPKK